MPGVLNRTTTLESASLGQRQGPQFSSQIRTLSSIASCLHCPGKASTMAAAQYMQQLSQVRSFVFSHWSSNDGNYNNAQADSMEVILASNTELTAHFDSCAAVIDVDIVSEGNTLGGDISQEVGNVHYAWRLNGTSISEDSLIYNPVNGDYELTVRFDSCTSSEIFY